MFILYMIITESIFFNNLRYKFKLKKYDISFKELITENIDLLKHYLKNNELVIYKYIRLLQSIYYYCISYSVIIYRIMMCMYMYIKPKIRRLYYIIKFYGFYEFISLKIEYFCRPILRFYFFLESVQNP